MARVGQFAVLFFLQLIGCFGDFDEQLKAVIVLFRHGDRSPLSSWPTDIYYGDSSLWPDGYGQLNNFGKQRHYHLGQWFRERYDGFLPQRYNRSDIYIKSTDVDRTLMSAQYNLAGLYPPVGDQIWNDNVFWQAIPVHTTPLLKDPILATDIACPKHSLLEEELLNSEVFQELNKRNADLYKNISEHTGMPLDQVNVATFSSLFSSITIYRGFNWSLPEWTDYYWPEISSLAAIKFQVSTYTIELARLRSGPFYNYFLEYLDAVRSGGSFAPENLSNAPKLLMLSAHDTTVADCTNSMGVYPDAVPQFASTVIWEVKSRNDSNYFLNVYFKNSTHFSPLTVKECEFDCSLADFSEIMNPIAVNVADWEFECPAHIDL